MSTRKGHERGDDMVSGIYLVPANQRKMCFEVKIIQDHPNG